MDTVELRDLLAAERAGWDALCSSTGGAYYRDLMTREAVMVLVDGSVLDRDAVAASLDGVPPWDEYELDDLRRVAIGPDAAALTYRGTARRSGSEPAFTARMTSVYTIDGDRLRPALYQQTALSD
ncbi:nuclear transport factor 2 family protein [Leifsonia sp. C5G2]|uniref:nuclear transport factor 2 family protein n=1 Tax=Leifsonia sp. C5G2 TaxID=2735269 RepID=UPI00158523E1|nr:nuclear transport factor 2 family protein [Leifsonia sp. C5G2]NUU06304.1 nuclear transport factor 2 family protein [Leifsonia sp. C5G2]